MPVAHLFSVREKAQEKIEPFFVNFRCEAGQYFEIFGVEYCMETKQGHFIRRFCELCTPEKLFVAGIPTRHQDGASVVISIITRTLVVIKREGSRERTAIEVHYRTGYN